MKQIALLVTTHCLLIPCLLTAQIGADETPFVPGELIIMLEKGVRPEVITEAYSQVRSANTELKHIEVLSELSNIHLYSFDNDATDEYRLLNTIRENRQVRAAQFNHYVKERATMPNDPLINQQWHHKNSNDKDIDSDLAWDITTGGLTANGDEIVVCVIEPGGTNYNHTDLFANHWRNLGEIPNNGIDDDGNGYVDDYNGWRPGTNSDNIQAGGHGTAVSGMIGARGNNGIGGSGVNWNVKLMQVQLGSLTESNVILAYNYPYTMRHLYNTQGGSKGSFVVATNASWGIDYANPANYPVWCNYYDDLGQVGILNCGATANNNVNIDVVGDMPTGCGSPYMVSVTATNSNDLRTFSAYGATTIDLAAPGGGVYLPSGSSGHSTTSGTSFASPCVAGGIALLYSAPCVNLANIASTQPQLAADMVRSYILNGVDPVSSLNGLTVTGGRLNVYNSLLLALDDCAEPIPCEPAGITLDTDCEYNAEFGFFDATITLNATLSTEDCDVETICYRFGSSTFTCIDLASANPGPADNSYIISSLLPAMMYEVYYTTVDGVSASAFIETGLCNEIVPGCTDPAAENYNPLATFDDGSCTYVCNDVTLTISTDCWGGEVSWFLTDVGNNVVAQVSSGTYGNQQNYTWSGCLPPGCYTFTILDSFGDGMNGQASGCPVNGNYLMVDHTMGQLLFFMAEPDANYGSMATHDFCISGDVAACAQPYPVATGLTATPQPNGVLLEWNPVPGSIACRLQGGLSNGAGNIQNVQVFGDEPSSFLAPPSIFAPQTRNYRWRVRCRCADDVQANWSPYAFFTYPPPSGINPGITDLNQEVLDVKIYPNPTQGEIMIQTNLPSDAMAQVRIFDPTGRLVHSELAAASGQGGSFAVDMLPLGTGFYLVQITGPDGAVGTQRAIVSR